jgi:hypothetical protein
MIIILYWGRDTMKYKTIAVFSTIISIMLIQLVLPLITTFQHIESVKALSRADQRLTSHEQPRPQTQTQRAAEQQPPLAHTQRAQINRAPIAISGDNKAYVTWWSNQTGNDEVMFKASTDGGKTFSEKMNLSNSSKSESQDAQIAATGSNVYVSWWERNQTMNEPVLRVSNDNGKTFGQKIILSAAK